MDLPLKVLFESNLQSLSLINRGKVRDIYAVDDEHMLIVTTDRLSAFDVVLPDPIPGKGNVLTEIANFWFARTDAMITNHLSDKLALKDILTTDEYQQVAGRAILVKKLAPLPIEAIVRGYLIGSGWQDYQANGKVCGIELPADLQQAQQLPSPIYTPSTKSEQDHDENISFDDTVHLIGADLATKVRDLSLEIYARATTYARTKGIIIADTKFEFGLDSEDKLVLIDEVLTPDSSRFWPMDRYIIGQSPPSFDKQYVRDYLDTLDWDKTYPGPNLPTDVVENTARKYREARDQLMQ